jgi:hypothetical protein
LNSHSSSPFENASYSARLTCRYARQHQIGHESLEQRTGLEGGQRFIETSRHGLDMPKLAIGLAQIGWIDGERLTTRADQGGDIN